MESSEFSNNARGWIMCVVSGIACVAGASIIGVDSLVRLLPGKKHFRIEESNAFLACSLSLSFGVMMFSALYNMLPASKRYLLKAEYEEDVAGFIMMGCFVGGFIGIQVLSRLLHQIMPSHVVDCDHSHNPEDHVLLDGHSEHDDSSRRESRLPRRMSSKARLRTPPPEHMTQITPVPGRNGLATESTPLLPTEMPSNHRLEALPESPDTGNVATRDTAHHQHHHAHHESTFGLDRSLSHPPHPDKDHTNSLALARRPSVKGVRARVMSFVKDTKSDCDHLGPCFGYTDPCGQECFKHMSSRSAISRTSSTVRTSIGPFFPPTSPFPGVREEDGDEGTYSPSHRLSRAQSRDARDGHFEQGGRGHDHAHAHAHVHEHHAHDDHSDAHDADADFGTRSFASSEDLEAQHHHHVPTNAFLSIGLQTVVAIALHKFPEGFITYATNVASPSLGFNVFMALFVHNIAEGFSLALPLYMALGSKLKALAWSSLLGGLSQPFGAALAWLWFRIAHRSEMTIDNVAYAALFAVTAGIMTSVALQLFVESLSLNHSRNLSIAFAFIGMVILGASSALVDDD